MRPAYYVNGNYHLTHQDINNNEDFEDENDFDGNKRLTIPKLSSRSWMPHASKKTLDFNRNQKKVLVKNNLNDSWVNLYEQIKINKNILKLQDQLNITIEQKNGQRKLGGPPPDWTGPPPGPGCEIFVGKIPRTIYEDVLYPIFRNIGRIYEMRLMMNFSGTNRGFAFIMYDTPEAAQRAIKQLDNYQIRPGYYIGVVESVNNCRLHVTDLPVSTQPDALYTKIDPVCEDIDKISVYTNLNNHGTKHALISFKTHRSAAMARRRLLPERKNFFDKADIKIEWAHPKITISNVFEECITVDDDGNLKLTKGLVKSDKKQFNERKKRPVPKYPVKLNAHRNDNNFCPSRIDYKEDLSNSDYSNSDCNAQSMFDDFAMCSMRSDESISELSKTSDSDDSKNMSFYSVCSSPYTDKRPGFLNPSDCSVVRFPFNPNQTMTTQHHVNYQTYYTPYPWKLANAGNMVSEMQNQMLQFQVPVFNQNFINTNIVDFNNISAKNAARPILSRNILTS